MRLINPVLMILYKQKGDPFIENVGQQHWPLTKLCNKAELCNWVPTQSPQCIQIISLKQSYTGLRGAGGGHCSQKINHLLLK